VRMRIYETGQNDLSRGIDLCIRSDTNFLSNLRYSSIFNQQGAVVDYVALAVLGYQPGTVLDQCRRQDPTGLGDG